MKKKKMKRKNAGGIGIIICLKKRNRELKEYQKEYQKNYHKTKERYSKEKAVEYYAKTKKL